MATPSAKLLSESAEILPPFVLTVVVESPESMNKPEALPVLDSAETQSRLTSIETVALSPVIDMIPDA